MKGETELATLTKDKQSSAHPHIHPPYSLARSLFFFTSGIVIMLGYYCMMAMVKYWISVYGSIFMTVMMFAMNAGGLIGFLMYRYEPSGMKIGTLVIYGPWVSIAIFTLCFLVGEYMEGQGVLKLMIGSVCAVGLGILNSTFHSAFAVVLFDFGPREIAAHCSGIGFAGILTTSIAIIQGITVGTEDQFRLSVHYQIFQFITTLIIFVFYYIYAKHPGCDVRLNMLIRPKIDPKDDTNLPSLKSTFKLMYPLLVTAILNYSTALMVYPPLLFGLGLGLPVSDYMEKQTILMVHHSFDFIGKSLYSHITISDTMANHYMTLSKLFIVFFASAPFLSSSFEIFKDQAAYTLTLAILSSFSVGYLSSSLLDASSRRVSKRHKANSAFLSILFLFIGLLYGSFTSLLGVGV